MSLACSPAIDLLRLYLRLCLERLFLMISFARRSRIAAAHALGHILPRNVRCFSTSRALSASLDEVSESLADASNISALWNPT